MIFSIFQRQVSGKENIRVKRSAYQDFGPTQVVDMVQGSKRVQERRAWPEAS